MENLYLLSADNIIRFTKAGKPLNNILGIKIREHNIPYNSMCLVYNLDTDKIYKRSILNIFNLSAQLPFMSTDLFYNYKFLGCLVLKDGAYKFQKSAIHPKRVEAIIFSTMDDADVYNMPFGFYATEVADVEFEEDAVWGNYETAERQPWTENKPLTVVKKYDNVNGYAVIDKAVERPYLLDAEHLRSWLEEYSCANAVLENGEIRLKGSVYHDDYEQESVEQQNFTAFEMIMSQLELKTRALGIDDDGFFTAFSDTAEKKFGSKAIFVYNLVRYYIKNVNAPQMLVLLGDDTCKKVVELALFADDFGSAGLEDLKYMDFEYKLVGDSATMLYCTTPYKRLYGTPNRFEDLYPLFLHIPEGLSRYRDDSVVNSVIGVSLSDTVIKSGFPITGRFTDITSQVQKVFYSSDCDEIAGYFLNNALHYKLSEIPKNLRVIGKGTFNAVNFSGTSLVLGNNVERIYHGGVNVHCEKLELLYIGYKLLGIHGLDLRFYASPHWIYIRSNMFTNKNLLKSLLRFASFEDSTVVIAQENSRFLKRIVNMVNTNSDLLELRLVNITPELNDYISRLNNPDITLTEWVENPVLTEEDCYIYHDDILEHRAREIKLVINVCVVKSVADSVDYSSCAEDVYKLRKSLKAHESILNNRYFIISDLLNPVGTQLSDMTDRVRIRDRQALQEFLSPYFPTLATVNTDNVVHSIAAFLLLSADISKQEIKDKVKSLIGTKQEYIFNSAIERGVPTEYHVVVKPKYVYYVNHEMGIWHDFYESLDEYHFGLFKLFAYPEVGDSHIDAIISFMLNLYKVWHSLGGLNQREEWVLKILEYGLTIGMLYSFIYRLVFPEKYQNSDKNDFFEKYKSEYEKLPRVMDLFNKNFAICTNFDDDVSRIQSLQNLTILLNTLRKMSESRGDNNHNLASTVSLAFEPSFIRIKQCVTDKVKKVNVPSDWSTDWAFSLNGYTKNAELVGCVNSFALRKNAVLDALPENFSFIKTSGDVLWLQSVQNTIKLLKKIDGDNRKLLDDALEMLVELGLSYGYSEEVFEQLGISDMLLFANKYEMDLSNKNLEIWYNTGGSLLGNYYVGYYKDQHRTFREYAKAAGFNNIYDTDEKFFTALVNNSAFRDRLLNILPITRAPINYWNFVYTW